MINRLALLKSKNMKAIIAAICIGAMISGCSESDKAKTNYQMGIEALESQNYSDALNYFKESENENSDMRLVYRGEGIANLGLANYDESILNLEKSLHESNGLIKAIDYDVNYYLATAQYKKGDLQAAYDTYTSILSLDKKASDAYYLRGKISLDMKKTDEAKNDYDTAISIDSTSPELYIRIYKDLVEAGFDNDAKSYINLALKNVAKPSTYQLGVFNYYLGDFTQARNYFEEAKETKNTAEGIVYIGKTYEALGDPNYAQTLYEQYITGDTDAPEVYNELGKLKFNQKDYEGALASFEAGLKSNDMSYKQSLMFNRIVANEYLHDFNTAAILMEEYISLYPDDAEALRENVFLSTR